MSAKIDSSDAMSDFPGRPFLDGADGSAVVSNAPLLATPYIYRKVSTGLVAAVSLAVIAYIGSSYISTANLDVVADKAAPKVGRAILNTKAVTPPPVANESHQQSLVVSEPTIEKRKAVNSKDAQIAALEAKLDAITNTTNEKLVGIAEKLDSSLTTIMAAKTDKVEPYATARFETNSDGEILSFTRTDPTSGSKQYFAVVRLVGRDRSPFALAMKDMDSGTLKIVSDFALHISEANYNSVTTDKGAVSSGEIPTIGVVNKISDGVIWDEKLNQDTPVQTLVNWKEYMK